MAPVVMLHHCNDYSATVVQLASATCTINVVHASTTLIVLTVAEQLEVVTTGCVYVCVLTELLTSSAYRELPGPGMPLTVILDNAPAMWRPEDRGVVHEVRRRRQRLTVRVAIVMQRPRITQLLQASKGPPLPASAPTLAGPTSCLTLSLGARTRVF